VRRYKPGAEVKRDELYVLNPEELRVGDIVLTTDPSSAESELIKISTGGSFSHTAICTEVGHLVEANTSGLSDPGSVRRLSTMRIVATDPQFMRVLRLKRSVEGHKSKAAKAAGFAEWAISSEYWWEGVRAFLRRDIPENEKKSFFCSHLVADAYKRAGCDLLQYTAPEKVGPGDIMTSGLLDDVTTSVLGVESEKVVMSYLPKPEESLHQQVEIFYQQRLLKDPRLPSIAARHREELPRVYWDVMLLLVRTRDAELDRMVTGTIQAMAHGFRAGWTAFALTEEKIGALRQLLELGMLSGGELQAELSISHRQKHIIEADIRKRTEDVAQNRIIYTHAKLAAFKVHLDFSIEYLEFMKGQDQFLAKQIALLEECAA
jgi:uncharacterized protein YycO